MNQQQPAIAFRNVEYSLEQRRIVGPLSCEVAVGEILVMLGRSGSGKTTALRLMNGLLMPDAGTVDIAGRSTTAWDPIALRRRTGYVIQETGLFPHLSVAANVGLVPKLEGWARDRIENRVDELLRLVRLDGVEYAHRFPRALSGGQRQRVGVARALGVDPPVLLCDEPFGALDPVTRRDLQREFLDLVRRLGKTVVFVTHDVSEARLLADRIVMFESGRAAFGGSVAEFDRSPDARVAAFREAAA
jgi:osmoprotectant transport system ATP-binding protein